AGAARWPLRTGAGAQGREVLVELRGGDDVVVEAHGGRAYPDEKSGVKGVCNGVKWTPAKIWCLQARGALAMRREGPAQRAARAEKARASAARRNGSGR